MQSGSKVKQGIYKINWQHFVVSESTEEVGGEGEGRGREKGGGRAEGEKQEEDGEREGEKIYKNESMSEGPRS